MRTALRLMGLLLALVPLGLPPAWAQTCPGSAPGGINYTIIPNTSFTTATPTGTRQGTGTSGNVGAANTYTDYASSTSLTYSNYTKNSTTGTNTNIFSVATNNSINGQTLVWQTSYDQAAPLASNQSTVTLTFNRLVDNLTLNLQDVDRGATWEDNLTFNGYTTVDANGNPTGTPIALTAANFTTSANNQYVSGSNTVTGTGSAAVGAIGGNLVVSYSQSIRALTIVYKNVLPVNSTGGNRLQTLGINSISWCRLAPVANNVTSAAQLSSVGAASISPLSSTVDGAVTTYNLTSIPNATTQGVLSYNLNGTYTNITSATQSLTEAQASTLRFAPVAGTSGNVTFGYKVTDNATPTNLTSANTATYTIPVSNALCTTAPASLNFNTRPANENWTTHATLGVGGSTRSTVAVNANDYKTAGTATTSTLVTGNLNNTQTLTWNTDYANQADNTSTVTFTFNRAVSNFTMRVRDIDKSEVAGGFLTTNSAFIDQVTFIGANGGTQVVPTLAPVNANTAVVTISGNTATGTGVETNATDGSVNAYFASAVTSVTLTYRNLTKFQADPTQNSIGIDVMSFCRLAPIANDVTNTATLPTNAGQVALDNLSSSVDGTVSKYTITAIPATTQGVLYYNSSTTATPSYTAVTATNTPLVLTAAQAASLRFDPADGATGANTTFSYTVTDDANLTSSTTTPAVFTIPLQSVTACTAPATLDFSTRANGEDWKARTGPTAVSAPTGSTVTQVSTSNYTVDANSLANSSFAIGTITTGNTIRWSNSYAAGSPKTSSVTFTFNRAVSNFTVRVEDIDANTNSNYLDQVVFAGKIGNTIVTPTLSPVDPNQLYFTITGNTATGIAGQSNNATRDGAAVVAYFSTPITSLTLTYNNAATGNSNGTQAVGVDLMTWCRSAPVANPVASTVSDAATKAAVGGLSSQVDGTATSYAFTVVPTTTQGTLYYNTGTVSVPTYQVVTTSTVITAAQASQLTFTPAAGFNGTFSLNYTVKDDANQVSEPATYAITVNSSGASGTPAACANPGRDGSPAGLTTNPDTYYPSAATQTLTGGTSNAIVVGAAMTGTATSATNIAVGDLLLVIQMQGADINATNTDAYGDGVAGNGANGNSLNTNFTAGTYEYVVANSAVTTAGGTIQLATTLKNSYVNAAATATAGQRSFQVIRVPQYGNLTLGGNITPAAWNGATGGIIAIDVAKVMDFNTYTIDASARGFRGGGGRVQSIANGNSTDYVNNTTVADLNAQKGEGTAGTPQYVNAPTTPTNAATNTVSTTTTGYPGGNSGRGGPGNAGGGGNDDINNSGGGGGANGGTGGRGGNNFSGANTAGSVAIGGEPGAGFGVVSSSRVVLGGGGGAGTTNGPSGTPTNGVASSGAPGGGIVLLRTGSISTNKGTILANGGSANNTVADDGSGGGGAGGTILVTASNTAGLSNLTLTANGGIGGTNTGGTTGDHGPGGGGGGGVILANGSVAAVSTVGGASGTTKSGGAFGAAPGFAGVANTQISNSVANSVSGANCPADVTTTITGPTTLSAGQPAGSYPAYTATFTNNGTGTASNVAQTVTLPAGAVVTAANLPTGATFSTTGTGTAAVTTVNFGTAASLNNGASNSFLFSFTAPTTTGAYPLTTNVATDANEGNNTATNTATLTLQVNNAPATCSPSYYDGVNAYSGLSAEYVAGSFSPDGTAANDKLDYFSTNANASSTIKRIDPAINFTGNGTASWGNILPPANGSTADLNNFSARYRGSIYIATAGTYTFYTNSDDASYLWIDGAALPANNTPTASSAIVRNGGNHVPIEVTSAPIKLTAGLHNILLFYAESAGGNSFTFSYSGTTNTGTVIAKQIVPNAILCAGLANVPPVAINTTNANIPNNAGPTTLSPSLSSPLAATDQDGTVTNYAIATLPTAAQGTLRLSDGTAVTLNQVITAAQAAGLTFQPIAGFVGNATFTFSAIDDKGQYSNDVATYTIPVSASADLTTTLAGPTILNAGQPSGTFTATFSNKGPNTASGVTQTVTIPAGATNVLVNGVAYTPSNNVIDFGTATTLANGATNTFTYSFTAPTTGPVTQTSNVGVAPTSTTSQGTNTAPDAATLTSTVNPVADVATTITPSATSVASGQPASFAVTFTNNGPSSASTVVGTVQLPAGLPAGSVTITGYGASTATYNATTGVITYPTVTTFTSGTTNSSTVSFTMPANGSLTATSTINTTTNEAGLTANDVASATINGTPVFDLITKISGPATTVAGTLTTYSVLTINNGPSTAANVGQTVQLPLNLTNVFVSNGGTYDKNSGVVTFPNLDALPNGATINNTISFMAPAFVAPATTFPISATVSGDVNTANNTAYLNGSASATNVTVTSASATNANLYTTITTPNADVQPNSAVTFTVVAGNNGPNGATGVVQRVSLPAGLTGVTITGNGASNANYDATTGLVTLPTITSLTSGSANTYTITVNAPASGMVAAIANISATTNDVMVADNVATTDVTISAASDVATTISGPTKANAGQEVTYKVTTTNNGIAPAANVVQTVNIPAGLASVTISGNGTYDPNTGIVTFPAIAGQVSGNSVQNTITYNAPAIATTTVIASVTSSSPDNVKTNNRATSTTTTDPIADVTVSLTGPTTIVQGNQIDYIVVTTNNGPSSASNVSTRVQLPAGLGTITLSTGGTYDNATGIVTFSLLGTERAGQPGTVSNTIRFIAPAGLSQINATASVSTASEEANYANNTSAIITAVGTPTTAQTDLNTTIKSTPTTLTAGQPVSLAVTTTNGGTGTATGVIQRVALEAGLTISSITNGGTYDPVTGIVTFPTIASLASGNTVTNTITLVAPGTNPLVVRALVTGNESDPDASNNIDFKSLTINPISDVATSVSGPTAVAAGDAVTYSVLTLNNGPSMATSVVQKVTIPAGLPTVVGSTSSATSLLVNGVGPTSVSGTMAIYPSGTYNSSTGVITFATIASQDADASSQRMNTISFTAPSTSFTVVGNVTTSSIEPNTAATTANNTSTVIVGPINTAPVANAVVNSLQTPQGNTAGALLLSPLSATDATGSIASYTITSIPNATTQGVLLLNGTAVKISDVVLAADASKLRFDPVATFIGNAFFTYTATDDLNAVSAVAATYTIPVGQDLDAIATASTQVKGNGNPYANGDVLTYLVDNNAAKYTANSGTTPGIVYNPTTGVVQAGADNGIRSATTDAAGTTTLANLGVSLDAATGQLTVTDRTKLKQGSYSVSITSIDANGGVTTQNVPFTIGVNPLPVTLVEFTVQPVQNRDALLNWSTASEQNNDHFEVERSLDGTRFTTLEHVAGQGTTSLRTAYAFTDASIAAKANGPVYYRLKQVDTDGTSTYSPVRTVRFTKAAVLSLSLYPNPAMTSTTLDLTQLPASATYQVLLLDATGRQVLATKLAGGMLQPLDVTNLATGTYNVLVTGTLADGSLLRQVLRLIKE